MAKARKERRKSLLVPLRRGQAGTDNYFMVSGLGGHVISFQILAKAMSGELSGYGILYPGFLADSKEEPSIEQTARLMLNEVLQVQPKGPYVFAGYSMGGYVCLEMARLLKERGEEAGVVMIDVKIFELAERKSIFRRAPVQIYWKIRRFFDEISGLRGRRTKRQRQAVLLQGEDSTEILPSSFDRVIREGWLALKRYRVSRCDVPGVLIRCKDHIWYDDLDVWLSDYGWGRFMKLIEVVWSPGHHLGMLNVSNAKHLGPELESAFGTLRQQFKRSDRDAG